MNEKEFIKWFAKEKENITTVESLAIFVKEHFNKAYVTTLHDNYFYTKGTGSNMQVTSLRFKQIYYEKDMNGLHVPRNERKGNYEFISRGRSGYTFKVIIELDRYCVTSLKEVLKLFNMYIRPHGTDSCYDRYACSIWMNDFPSISEGLFLLQLQDSIPLNQPNVILMEE